MFGAASIITPLNENPDLPNQYFNFRDRGTLISIVNNDEENTDYYGFLKGNFEDKLKKDGSPFVNFTLTDASNQDISVTLWKEVASNPEQFDRQAIEQAGRPVLLAVTAMKVKSYMRQPQLKSTFGTFVFLNPQTPETEALLNRYRNPDSSSTSADMQLTVKIPITTIADLLQKQPSDISGKTFMCNASITQIIQTIDWYRDTCPKCTYDIFLRKDGWFCPTDGKFENAKHTYQISVIISDGTADLHATLSDQAATTMIGMDSSELRIIDVCDPIVRMPPQIVDLKGKSMTFEIQAQKDSQTGSIKATIHKANETTPETQTPSAKPSTTVMTTPTPQTPAKTTTQRLQGKRLEFDTPGAESSDSSGSKRQKTKA